MIEIKDLSAGYGTIDVLKNINLTIKNNLSIIGPNGCGKTTLLRALAGVLDFKGDILIDSVSIKKIKGKILARKIAMLSQFTSLYFNYNVIDMVLMGRFAHSSGLFSAVTKTDREKAEEALKTVGLSGIKEKGIASLSGGQLQRVYLAKIICQEPEIILLDEPTNHLDISHQSEFMDFVVDWAKKENKIIIGVLHDFNLAMRLSEDILLLDKG